jgi:glycosyltransferase involved in cell wall biosynthesis
MLIIITTFYNAEDYIEKCIGSIIGQNHSDFKCFLIDDMSTDSSAEKASQMIDGDERFSLIINTDKKYKTLNFIDVLKSESINDDDVVVEIDGDDWLPNSNVLSRIFDVYRDEKVWITNGNFKYASGPIGFSAPQINFNTLRTDRFTASHLRTWRVFLWRNIKDVDHRDSEGNYLTINADLAYMLPMLEMSGSENYKYLSDVNLIYNDLNPINDHKVNIDLVNKIANEIRNKPKYNKLIK